MAANKYQREVFNLANELLSTYIRLKEIHFNTLNQAEHLLTDEAAASMLTYQDALMENILGLFDNRPGFDIMRSTPVTGKDFKVLLKALRTSTLRVKALLDQPIYSGIHNILDDLMRDLNRFIYLSSNK